MTKKFAHDLKFGIGQLVGPGVLSIAIVGALGLGLLIMESVLLSAQGIQSGAESLTAILAASTLSSIAGFAFSAISGAMLFHIMDDQVYAVQVMTVCSIGIQLFSVVALWRSVEWRSLPTYVFGGIFGVPAGVYLLLNLNSGAYRVAIGVLLIAYGSYLLMRHRTRTFRTGPLADACAGFFGGLTGGLAAFPGAAVTIWCNLKGWDKSRQRGVYQPFILLMQPVTLIAIHLMRPTASTAPMDWKVLVFIPAAVLGTWFGLFIFKRLSDRQFELAVCALLIVSGIGLVV
jgi:uncharacterized membrane protein YfcA